MIKVCLADNHPVVHIGVQSYLKKNETIDIFNNSYNYESVLDLLKNEKVDVLVIDLELEGLLSINMIKYLSKNFPDTKIVIYTNLSDNIYTSNAIKAGASAYVHKTKDLETLEYAIQKVVDGDIILDDDVKKKLQLIAKQNKNERLYRKLSSREIEVLRYFSDGKRNKEIADLLNLNEKTISTYKLRLLTKLNVTNLVDLVNKAKTLDIV